MARKRRRKKKYKKYVKYIVILILFALYTIYVDDSHFKDILNSVKQAVGIEDKPKKLETKLDGLNVYFIDVGQADSILISDNGENMLVDAGNNEDGEKVVNYLKSLNINKFKYVVVTHAHEDHIGGMDNVLKSFDFQTFFTPNVFTTTRTFEEVLDVLDAKGKKFNVPKVGKEYTLKDAKFKILYVGEESEDLNDSSIVIKLTYGNVSFMLMGDAPISTEKKILNDDIKADVLKLGHHGSKYSSCADFLFKVNPKYAIVSAGDKNQYHHPHPSTVKKLAKLNTKVYSTYKYGTIIINTDGEKININTMRTDTNGK